MPFRRDAARRAIKSPMAREKNLPRTIALAAAFAFLAAAAATSPFWRATIEAFSLDGSSYANLRTLLCFGGIPMDQIAARLNSVLAPGERIRLGPSISNSEFLQQRFSEALYPRLVDERSSYRIEVVPPAAYSGPPERTLGAFRVGAATSMVVLFGPPSASRGATFPSIRLDLSWLQFLGACISALGFGLVLLAAMPRRIRPPDFLALPVAILLCALLFALLVSGATWVQVPLSWVAAAAIGPFLFVGIALFAERRRKSVTRAFRGADRVVRKPENGVFLALLLLFTARVARVPILGWDGRSIWFFRAKQIFEHGMLARHEALLPSIRFAHLEYPLFFPAWAAFFSSHAGGYNEHLAAMGIPVLFAACAGTLWVIARKAIGRWLGAAFTGIAFFSLEGSLGAGYIDGLLCLLLLVEFLSLATPDFSSIGWIAAAAASLLKQEGLFFAVAVSLLCIATYPHLRARSLRARAAPFLVFLPGLLQFAWARRLGIHGDFYGIQWERVFSDFGVRTSVVAAGAGSILRNGLLNTVTRGLLPAEGAAAGLIVIALLVLQRRRVSLAAAGSFLLGMAFASFVLAVLLVTPQDIRWHVGTSLGRLLLTPSLFFVLALFCFLRDLTRVPPRDAPSAAFAISVTRH